MRIALGSDHRGYQVKLRIMNLLRERSHQTDDLGTHSTDSVDYPDVALAVAQRVADGSADRAILICGTGLGMALAANKVPGIRATPVHDDVTACARSHNDSNILCPSATCWATITSYIWLNTSFEGGVTHGGLPRSPNSKTVRGGRAAPTTTPRRRRCRLLTAVAFAGHLGRRQDRRRR